MKVIKMAKEKLTKSDDTAGMNNCYVDRVKHSAEYHLKQLDKIAKTGVVPDEYKKSFRGIKYPASQIRKRQREINDISVDEHKAHIKDGLKTHPYCDVCKDKKGSTKGKDDNIDEIEVEPK